MPESLLSILASHEINTQAHGYCCSLHLRVFEGHQIQGNVCVLTPFSWSKDTPRYEAMGERIPMEISIYEVKGRSLKNMVRAPANP
jgi:hypothetical protein